MQPEEMQRMNRSAWPAKLYHRVCLAALFFVAAAASFNGSYAKWHFREAGVSGAMAPASFDAILNGTAARPYVYRQLLPAVARWLDGRIPRPWADQLFMARGSSGTTFISLFFDSPLARDRAWFVRYWIVYVLVFLFAWLAVCALYELGKAAGFRPVASALAAIAFILLMPYFCSVGGYFYDYPELAFMALAAWMALKCRWGWMVPLAALAACNHESFLFYVLALYPLLRLRTSRLSALVGTGTMVAACGLVYAALRWRFQGNGGGAVENHALEQMRYLLDLFINSMKEKTYGLPMVQPLNLVFIALLVWTAVRGWRWLPRAFQRHAQIAAAINVPLFILFCSPGEWRNLSMLYVALFMLMAANVQEWMGAVTPADKTAP
jgi:hypothetical protein